MVAGAKSFAYNRCVQLIHFIIYGAVKLLFTCIFKVFFRTRFVGRDRVPRTGGLLVVSNHISFADPPLLAVGLPRPIDFMTMIEIFRKPVLGALARAAGCFPVDRSRADAGSAREAVRRLRAGRCVGIFPEGGIRLTEQSVLGGDPIFKPGAGLIALMGGVPILPVVIRDARRTYQWRNWLRRAEITVTFGCSFCLWIPEPHDTRHRRAVARQVLREQLLKTVELK
ncbi:MAG: 1-acyl-sn-glycerol-3-phosphate acyltransferase [Verrucomicrobia bacterium]|nr:1-acyl-sn-glycerol-3-phosphate acyltransferase [Verrucomicrobiota bacterium]